jgi:hypothetical protein
MQRRNLLMAGACALLLSGRAAAQQASALSQLRPAMRNALTLKAEIAKAPRLATLDLRLASGSTLQLRVQEGAMTLLGFDDRQPLRFIVARDRSGTMLELRPVRRVDREVAGRVVPTLFVAPATGWGATTEDLRSVGVETANLVTVEPLTDAMKRAAQSSICYQEPCEGTWLCCIFRGCDGALVQVCSTGQCVGGSDGCGECFVCS